MFTLASTTTPPSASPSSAASGRAPPSPSRMATFTTADQLHLTNLRRALRASKTARSSKKRLVVDGLLTGLLLALAITERVTTKTGLTTWLFGLTLWEVLVLLQLWDCHQAFKCWRTDTRFALETWSSSTEMLLLGEALGAVTLPSPSSTSSLTSPRSLATSTG